MIMFLLYSCFPQKNCKDAISNDGIAGGAFVEPTRCLTLCFKNQSNVSDFLKELT